MGHFSNGTEGLDYQEKFCKHCANWRADEEFSSEETCGVMFAHQMHNYDQNTNPKLKEALSILIPRNGIENGKCSMFLPKIGSEDSMKREIDTLNDLVLRQQRQIKHLEKAEAEAFVAKESKGKVA